jgi:2-polyprenyl-6-hydroxyphenyl methylase/3-demethylubiquinone-9 3-methyltransferase
MENINADAEELAKFGEIAHRWWDPNSEFRPLHDINPLRIDWVDRRSSVLGKRALDIGCGGGLLSEALAKKGAVTTGIDLSARPLAIARLHLLESDLQVDYREVSAETLAAETPASFDIVTCMEMLEHVPDPASIVRASFDLLKPGGQAFFSTINRNPKAYLLAVVGAEYVMRLLPRGTHDYAKFLRPAELAAACREAGLAVEEIVGMTYNPFTRTAALSADTAVNYLVRARKP